MKKGLFAFSLVISVVTLLLIGMLYWSSTLVEHDLKKLQEQIVDLSRSIDSMRINADRWHQDVQLSQLSTSDNVKAISRKHIDSRFPNLLESDPFYEKTLPSLLGPDFEIQGVRHEAILGKPENLHPFNSFRDVSSMINLCSISVAQMKFGQYETLSPNMAIKLEARPLNDSPSAHEYWVHLRDDVYWEPLRSSLFPTDLDLSPHFLKKHQVTAYDFKFFYDAVMNPHVSESKAASLRNYFNDIDEIRVIDDFTFVVRWRTRLVENVLGEQEPKVKYAALGLTGSLQPLPSFVFKYFADGKKIIEDDEDPDTYRKNSVWAQNFAQHWAKNIIVSCGPWIFEGMTEEGVRMRRNSGYYQKDAVLVEGLLNAFKESHEAIWQAFKGGGLDLCSLAPNQQPELEQFLNSQNYLNQKSKGLGIEELNYLDLAFYYIGWNEVTPYFSSRKVRRAMTMAIDRDRIIEQNLNDMGMPITGPFFRYSPAYDPEIEAWPFNPYEAKRLLDEEGWIDLNGDGIRDKMINGKRVPFRFYLTYYAKNISTKSICEFISTSLREIGVDCQLKGVDITDLSHAFEDKDFDAFYMGWALGTPPENPRQLWHSSGAKEKGSSNSIGFMNSEVDSIIDALDFEYNKEKRIELYHRFHRIIHEEQPYTFLYSPKQRLLYREYVKNLFIPRERQDLVPGADVTAPDLRVIWLDYPKNSTAYQAAIP